VLSGVLSPSFFFFFFLPLKGQTLYQLWQFSQGKINHQEHHPNE